MRISVIVAVYNRGDFVRRCLDSLNEQSHRPSEVVLCDDGSEEDIIGAVRDMAGSLAYSIVYVRQEHRGFRLAKSKNNGVRHSTGSYLIFNDQDIIHTRDYIQTFVRHHRHRQFLVAYPVRFTPEQMIRLDEGTAASELITPSQIRKVRRQFRKDSLEHVLSRLLGTGRYRLKLRGGVFGIDKEDLLRVDGFDENYQGWGYEDDDLGRRLYRSGVSGRNVFSHQFPIHLCHQPHHQGGVRTNLVYYQHRIREIRQGGCRAVRGLSQTEDDEEISVVHIQ